MKVVRTNGVTLFISQFQGLEVDHLLNLTQVGNNV